MKKVAAAASAAAAGGGVAGYVGVLGKYCAQNAKDTGRKPGS
jgi:hypothetical protein